MRRGRSVATHRGPANSRVDLLQSVGGDRTLLLIDDATGRVLAPGALARRGSSV
jgi:hypothetical protein